MKLSTTRLVLAIAVVLAGAGGAAYGTGMIQKPDAGLVDKGDWLTSGEQIEVKSTAYISNPNPLRLNLSTLEASYTLKMNSVKLAEGRKEGLYVPKNENRTVNFTTELKTGNIPNWWVTHLRNDEKSNLRIPIKAEMNLGPLPLSGSYTYRDSISTDIESQLSSSLSQLEGNYSRQLGPEAGLEATTMDIEVVNAEARFGDVNMRHTELVMPLKVKNRNDYPIATPQLEGSLNMNGVRIADLSANDIETASDTSIPPGDTREIVVKAEMSNQNIDDWFNSHVRKQEKTDAELNVYLGFDVGDITVKIPSNNGMTCRFSFATKILVDEKQNTEGFKGCSGILKEGKTENGDQESSDESLIPDGTDEEENQSENSSDDKDGGLGGVL